HALPRLAADTPLARPAAILPLADVSRRQGAARNQQEHANLTGRALGDGRGDTLGQRRAAHQDIWASASGDRALRRRERAACGLADSPADGGPLVHDAHLHVLLHHAGSRLPVAWLSRLRPWPRVKPATDYRVGRYPGGIHHTAEPAVLPDWAAAERAGRDSGRAGAVRARLRVSGHAT